jgi:AbrB family looped-hinge helix DNA binding protein
MPAKQSVAHKRLNNVATVTLSSKFKIEIPPEMREALGLKPGQRLQVFQFQNRIELIPWIPMHKALGMFPGIDTDIERERS